MYTDKIELSDTHITDARSVHYFTEGETHVGVMIDVDCYDADGVEIILTKSEVLDMLEKINEEDGIDYTYSEEEIDD